MLFLHFSKHRQALNYCSVTALTTFVKFLEASKVLISQCIKNSMSDIMIIRASIFSFYINKTKFK